MTEFMEFNKIARLPRACVVTEKIDGTNASIVITEDGSVAAPGFMKPEGIVVWHEAARVYFKKTVEKDNEWKGKQS